MSLSALKYDRYLIETYTTGTLFYLSSLESNLNSTYSLYCSQGMKDISIAFMPKHVEQEYLRLHSISAIQSTSAYILVSKEYSSLLAKFDSLQHKVDELDCLSFEKTLTTLLQNDLHYLRTYFKVAIKIKQ